MRVLCYTDAQATDGHERCFTDPSRPLQLWRIQRLYEELQRIYRAYRCDALWDLGDTTDDRSAIPVSVIDLLCDSLEFFTGEWNLKLVGNHEQFLRDTRIHAGKMFRRFFHVVNTTETMKLGKVNILCVSYHDDIEAIREYLRRAPKDKPCVLIGHFQVAGCAMSSGLAVTGVPREEIEFVNVALLGHIHKPQSLGTGHIHYVGSPFQQHWGEAGEDKRVAILDITDTAIHLEWVKLEGFPRYHTVNFDTFCQVVKEDSEERYKVVLSDLAQTEKFYAHPLANRADEAIYAYTQAVEGQSLQTNPAIPRAKTAILEEYVNKYPPGNVGIALDPQSVLEFGEAITQSHE